MDLDLGLAANFVVLAEERHFGRAAIRLHLSSSALTKQIQHLERQLGVVLIERGPAGVSHLTAPGVRFAIEVVPLLAHANAVRQAARSATQGLTIRLGFPAGSEPIRQRMGMATIAATVRRTFPRTRIALQDIPFDGLWTCLSDRRVDILWTDAAVRQSSVESTPLPVSAERIGIVSIRHRLADAGPVHVEDFSDEPMLFNPTAPPEWMAPFWLEDVRPRRAARLIEIDEMDAWHVLHRVARGDGVMTTLNIVAPPLPRHLKSVQLIGAIPVTMYAARRRSDHRPEVRAVIDALGLIAAPALAAAK
jgi:DNA-binding transcriptional LysR family regulator